MAREIEDVGANEDPIMLSVEFPTWEGITLRRAGDFLMAIANAWRAAEDPHDMEVSPNMQLQASVVKHGDDGRGGVLPIVIRARRATEADRDKIEFLLDGVNLTRARFDGPVNTSAKDSDVWREESHE